MSDAQALALVRLVHTAIYLVVVVAIFVVLYAAITGAHGDWLWVALGLVSLESLVFAGCGMKCPLTAIAVKHGAGNGPLFDTFLPERFTRHTLAIFGPLIVLGLILLAARGYSAGWFGLG
jgi:hypothetical protein